MLFKLPKRKNRGLLWTILVFSGILHAVIIAIVGGITIYHGVTSREGVFDAPDPHETIERQRLEMQARTMQRQRETQRPQQRLQVRSPGTLNVPSVDIQVPDLSARVNVGGFGGGMGDFGGASGLSISPATVTIQDVQATGEKFLFLIDANPQLMIDARGGMPTYEVIKEDIMSAVRDLPTGVLFNAAIYHGRRIQFWSRELQPKNDRTVNAFESWLRPINTNQHRLGVHGRTDEPNYLPGNIGEVLKEGGGGSSAQFYVLAAALEQRADNIFWLAPDAPAWDRVVHIPEDARERAQRETERLRIRAGYRDEQGQYDERAYQRDRQRLEGLVRRAQWEENRERTQRGLPPKVWSGAEVNELRRRIARENDMTEILGLSVGADWVQAASEREMKRWVDQLQRVFYDDQRLSRPTINKIIFKGEDERWTSDDDRRVRDFVREFGGRHRVLFGLGRIEDNRRRR